MDGELDKTIDQENSFFREVFDAIAVSKNIPGKRLNKFVWLRNLQSYMRTYVILGISIPSWKMTSFRQSGNIIVL